MGSDAIIIKIASGIQKLIGGGYTSLLSFKKKG
jgi:hypothetical protein